MHLDARILVCHWRGLEVVETRGAVPEKHIAVLEHGRIDGGLATFPQSHLRLEHTRCAEFLMGACGSDESQNRPPLRIHGNAGAVHLEPPRLHRYLRRAFLPRQVGRETQ